jgi:hypothetical protein
MPNDRQTVQKGVSTHTEVRESQGSDKPAYFQQPDVITLPTLPTTQQVGGSQPATTSQTGNGGSGKSE